MPQYPSSYRLCSDPWPGGHAIMCAYKLCKVEFRYWGMQVLYCTVLYCTVLYWGMQGKIERFIHDMALRNTMLRAHTQAWVWQDEWHGLTMEDIRDIERRTAEELKKKMAGVEEEEEDKEKMEDNLGNSFNSIEVSPQEAPNIAPKPRIHRESLSSVNHIEKIEMPGDAGGDSEEEFFDCKEVPEDLRSLTKWNSMELVPDSDIDLNGML